MQISSSIHDPDRSCRVSCQDEILRHRYYFVVGSYGFFPLGTKCSHHQERYCINGKCLEFGDDDVPLTETLRISSAESPDSKVGANNTDDIWLWSLRYDGYKDL
uniref:Uncharacterized protein n=1 Tax=Megaselia scalaris TaxID=36166 RepID=T1H341_MEGSC